MKLNASGHYNCSTVNDMKYSGPHGHNVGCIGVQCLQDCIEAKLDLIFCTLRSVSLLVCRCHTSRLFAHCELMQAVASHS